MAEAQVASSLIQIYGAGGMASGIIVYVVGKLIIDGIKANKNGSKPSSTLTAEVGKLGGTVEALEKRHVELKNDFKEDIGKVEQAVKDQAISTNASIKDVHTRINTMSSDIIKEIRNGHGKG